MIHVARSLAVYALAACCGVALAQDPSGGLVLGGAGEVATPVGLVLAAAIVRGWTPTIRVVHVQESPKV
jgi:hypothetical protein